jgi:cytochrome b
MKDTVITARRKKIELITLLVCFVVANAFNLYAIIAHNTSYLELLTALGYVLLFTLALYVAWSAVRLLFYGLKRLFSKNQ